MIIFQSVLSLDSAEKTKAMEFLKECANNFGLAIPDQNGNCSATEVLLANKIGDDLISTSEVKDVSAAENPSCFNPDRFEIKENGSSSVSKEGELLQNIFESCQNDSKPTNNLKQNEINENSLIEEKNNVGIKKKNSKSKIKQLHPGNDSHSLNESCTAEDEMLVENSDSLEKHNNKVSGDKKTLRKKKRVENEYLETENDTMKCPGCMVICDNKTELLQHFTTHGKAPMSCRLCRASFNSMLNFWKHQKKKECKMSLLKCLECGEKFKYRRHYLKHVLGHNDNNCRYCDEKFSTWVLYKHHLKEKHPDIKMERDLIPCKFCAMSFRRHLGLYNHYQVEHSKGKFVCLSCGLLLPTKEKYKEHALVHESEKSWKCKICKMKFYRRQQLLFHVSVHKSGTYKCLTCDITVTSKVDLYKHKKDGHEVKGLEPKFECEICHKNFKKKVVLKNHLATHSKEKKYYCKHCVKSFRTLDALQKHQKRKSHFEKAKIVIPESKYEKVYEDKLICESCGKQYKTQRELTWHLRVHKSIYECHECGKTFTLKVNLTKHIRLHRNKVCVVCELCGNTFNQLSALNEHILMKHSDVRNAECEICKKKFKRKSELNRHMRIHEQKRPFACFCGTAFKQSSHLQTHYKTFHEKNAQQNNLISSGNFGNSATSEVYNESMVDRRKPIYVNGDHGTLLTLGNIEPDYRNANSFEGMQVNENIEGNSYALRYSQTEMDPINVTYEELNFETSQPDKRELVFTSPAIDLSMVTIPEVVETDMTLAGHRDIAETVETFNKLPDDASNLQLVNLSEHIVQEYLLNLP